MLSSLTDPPQPTIGKKPMSPPGSPPICVDLDGTLLQTDTLHEGLLQLLRRQPLRVVQLLLAVGRGKASFKQAVTRATALDPATLPMNEDLLAYLHAQKAAGRPLALFSAADTGVVDAVAEHLGLFEYAQGSDGTTNLSGADKLAAIRKRYGDDFVYAGNARVDLPIWKAAKGAIAVTSDDRLASDAANLVPLEARIRPHGGWCRCLVKGSASAPMGKEPAAVRTNSLGWPACHHPHAASGRAWIIDFQLAGARRLRRQ